MWMPLPLRASPLQAVLIELDYFTGWSCQQQAAAASLFFVHNVPPLPLSLFPCVTPSLSVFRLLGVILPAIHCHNGLRRHE